METIMPAQPNKRAPRNTCRDMREKLPNMVSKSVKGTLQTLPRPVNRVDACVDYQCCARSGQ